LRVSRGAGRASMTQRRRATALNPPMPARGAHAVKMLAVHDLTAHPIVVHADQSARAALRATRLGVGERRQRRKGHGCRRHAGLLLVTLGQQQDTGSA